MKKVRIFSALLIMISFLLLNSCAPTIKVTSSWINKERIPAEPIKSVFIIAFTDNMELRNHLESDLAAAAVGRGMKAYKSLDIIGPVDIKHIAPVKDVFVKKLTDLNCESIFTVALVHEISDTKYVPGTNYTPYGYGMYGDYGGYGATGMYGGFGGYYGYAVSTMSTSGYYTTNNKYFIEGKLFDLKTGEVLLSIQSKAENPEGIEKSSKQYTKTLMAEVENLRPSKK